MTFGVSSFPSAIPPNLQIYIVEGHANIRFVCLDYVINMQGTKKVEIPEVIMRDIMTVALDDSNYPILIHCNHGKVCILHRDTPFQVLMAHSIGPVVL